MEYIFSFHFVLYYVNSAIYLHNAGTTTVTEETTTELFSTLIDITTLSTNEKSGSELGSNQTQENLMDEPLGKMINDKESHLVKTYLQVHIYF